MATVAELGARVLRRLGVAAVAAADRPALTATVTLSDIATRALRRLGVVAADEAPAALDLAAVVVKAAAVHDGLVASARVGWADTAIPRAVGEEYVVLVAAHAASDFGKQADPAVVPAMEDRIRRVALLLTAPALAEQKVMAVHASLSVRQLTRWSVFDIPDYAEESYVVLAANMLAPEFGLPVDGPGGRDASHEIARVIALGPSGETMAGTYF